MSDSEAKLLIHDVENVEIYNDNKPCVECKFYIPLSFAFSPECYNCDNGYNWEEDID